MLQRRGEPSNIIIPIGLWCVFKAPNINILCITNFNIDILSPASPIHLHLSLSQPCIDRSTMAVSPFPASFSKPGEGHLIARLLPNGISGLVKATFQYPLKIITPPSPVGDLKSALAFLLTYGGGLVAGDQVHLKVRMNFIVYQLCDSCPARQYVLHIAIEVTFPTPSKSWLGTHNVESNIPLDRRPPLCQTHPRNTRSHQSI